MSIFGDIAKAAGSVVGGAFGGPIGAAVGGALGGAVGNVLGDLAGKALNEFEKDPLGALANPKGFASQYVDHVLKDMGVPAPFRNLVKFAQDPAGSILGMLAQKHQCTQPTRGPDGAANDQGSLKTNGQDVVDTGRYLISAREDGLKIYDKQTNTWVKAEGDPHLSTSDGDKGQFHKNLTIDLPDGTTVKIKTTPQQANGTSFIDKVAVMKGDEAVVMSGFHDGKAGVHMGEVFHNADEVNQMWGNGTVLRAGREVDDLRFARGGGEIRGGDPFARFGEHELDGRGGVSQADRRLDGTRTPGGTGGTGGAGGAGETGQTGGTRPSRPAADDDISGGSIFEILAKLLNKAQRKLADKVNELKNLQAPDGKDTQATADFDSKKQTLLIEIQQAQNEVKQLSEMQSNILKTDDQIKSSTIRNLGA